MIRLFTGTPGAGKTLRSIFEALPYKDQGRSLYHLGIDGMDPSLIAPAPFSDLSDWRNLPPGSILIVDEAHKYLPVRSPGKPVEWIQLLTEIRHFGIELWLVTQDPRNIDSFVRRLVGSHTHLTRKMGFNAAMVRQFEGISEDPQDPVAKKTAISTPWTYPKHLFSVYKSATLHTVKKRVPFKVWSIGLGVLLGTFFIIYAIFSVISSFSDDRVVKDTDVPRESSSSSFLSVPTVSREETTSAWSSPEAFIEAHKPLVPHIPWSAPIHAGLTPTSVPEIYCIAVYDEDDPRRRCSCYTEQATRLPSVPKPVCEAYVKNGSYNPYRPSASPPGASQAAPGGSSPDPLQLSPGP